MWTSDNRGEYLTNNKIDDREVVHNWYNKSPTGSDGCRQCNNLWMLHNKTRAYSVETLRRVVLKIANRYSLFVLLEITTPTTIPMIARMTMVKMKHIHRFLRAARADLTAAFVWPKLQRTVKSIRSEQTMPYPASVSFSTFAAVVSITLIVSSCCSTKMLIWTMKSKRDPQRFSQWTSHH
jgi:hypothetical protein